MHRADANISWYRMHQSTTKDFSAPFLPILRRSGFPVAQTGVPRLFRGRLLAMFRHQLTVDRHRGLDSANHPAKHQQRAGADAERTRSARGAHAKRKERHDFVDAAR